MPYYYANFTDRAGRELIGGKKNLRKVAQCGVVDEAFEVDQYLGQSTKLVDLYREEAEIIEDVSAYIEDIQEELEEE